MVKMVNAIVAIIALIAMFVRIEADEYTVGDDLGWTIPPGGADFYVEWASEHVPIVTGIDSITFRFKEGDVGEVGTKEEFDACDTSNMSWNSDESPIILGNTPGIYYYVSSFPDRCAAGQKIALEWSDPSSSAIAANAAQCPSPSPSASAEANASAKLPRKVIPEGV